MNLCSITTSKYPHNLMNRCIRDPYVQWCERRTSSLTSGEAVYSISYRFTFDVTRDVILFAVFCFELVHATRTNAINSTTVRII